MDSYTAWWLQPSSIYGGVLLVLLVLVIAAFIDFLSKRD